MEVRIGNEMAEVELLSKEDNKVSISINGTVYDVDIVMAENGLCSIITKDGKSYNAEIRRPDKGNEYTVNVLFDSYQVEMIDLQTKYLRNAINRGTTSKIGALFLRPVFEELTRSFDYSTYGGAPMLGLEGCLVKCHGSSKGLAITNGIEQATRFVEGNVASVISETISEMGFEESEQ